MYNLLNKTNKYLTHYNNKIFQKLPHGIHSTLSIIDQEILHISPQNSVFISNINNNFHIKQNLGNGKQFNYTVYGNSIVKNYKDIDIVFIKFIIYSHLNKLFLI